MICRKCGKTRSFDDNIGIGHIGFKCLECGYINNPVKELEQIKQNRLKMLWFQNEIRKRLRR